MRQKVSPRWRDGQWRPFYAWLPVRTKDGWRIWLEWCYSRWDGHPFCPEWEYVAVLPEGHLAADDT